MSKLADLCGLVIVVVVLGQEINALDGVWQVLLKVLSIHAWPHTAQVPIPYNTCNMSAHDDPSYWQSFLWQQIACLGHMHHSFLLICTWMPGPQRHANWVCNLRVTT